MISDPLTLFMCSSIGDGAAVIFLCSQDYAKKIANKPVYVRASSIVSAIPGASELVAVRAGRAAHEQAGIGTEDIHMAELNDESAPAELISYENIGFCAPERNSTRLNSNQYMVPRNTYYALK